MHTRDDGGPAFPGEYIEEFRHTDPDTDEVTEVERELMAAPGMSLRDWFAGQVAAAVMTNAEGLGTVSKEDRRAVFDIAAELSYELADAMLAARN